MRGDGNRPASRVGARPGFLLVYRGAEIGVVERVERDPRDGTERLHVRGGISGGLAYLVPAAAIGTVDPAARRAEVRESVTFVPDPIGGDGLVRLSASVQRPVSAAAEGDVAPRVGARVRADDGSLGRVESVSLAQGTLRSVVVRGRRRLRTCRYEVPAELLHASGGTPGEFRVDAARRDLRAR